MPILILLIIEVRSKAALEITLIRMIEMVDPLAPKMITLGENHAIMTNIITLAASAERDKIILTLIDPNSLAPSVANLIISPTIVQIFKSSNNSGKVNNRVTLPTLKGSPLQIILHQKYCKILSLTHRKGWSNNKTQHPMSRMMTIVHRTSL